MTISTQASSVTLAGNGVTAAFNFSFVGAAAADIGVMFTSATGVQTVLAPSQYILAMNPPAAGQIWGVGGTVTYPISGAPIAAGTLLTITRTLPLTQVISISNQGDFYPQSVEQALDTLCMELQQVATTSARTLQLNPSTVGVSGILPPTAQLANQLLGFNNLGEPIAAQPSSALVSSAMQPVVSAATTLAALNDLTNSGSMIVDANSNWLLGLPAAETNGDLQWCSIQDAGAPNQTGGALALMEFSNDPSCAFLGFFKSRSPVKGVQTTVQYNSQPSGVGDDIGEINFHGSDGTNYIKSAFITTYVAGPVSAGVVPSAISFWTTNTDGAPPTTPRMVLNPDGSTNFYPLNSVAMTIAPLGSTGGAAVIRANSAYSSTIPIYTFSNNDNTGIGNPAANTISFIVGNGEAARFDDSSNLLVGTTANPNSSRIVAYGVIETTVDAGFRATNAINSGGSSAGTLNNAPSAGNPAFWLKIVINGVNRFIPCW